MQIDKDKLIGFLRTRLLVEIREHEDLEHVSKKRAYDIGCWETISDIINMLEEDKFST